MIMNRDDAIDYIRTHPEDYLRKAKKKGFVCPICGSGSGSNGTGLTNPKKGDGKEIDKVHFSCWAGGCFTNADVIDIIGLERRLTSFPDKLQAAADEYRITIDGTAPRKKNQKQPKIEQPPEPPEEDYTEFFLQANRDIEKTSYHRGLSLETLNHFKIGHVEQWRHPKVSEWVQPTPRLIIPTSKYSYTARDERAEIPESQKEYVKEKVGHPRIFNAKAIRTATRPIFVIEGEIDAMSIYDVGWEAVVALGSTSYKGKLIAILEDMQKENKPIQPLIVAMDNDDPGRKAAREIDTLLTGIGVQHTVVNLMEGTTFKDANEFMNADREAFKAAVEKAGSAEAEAEREKQEQEREELRRESIAYSLQSFIEDMKDETPKYIPTGFEYLDKLLDGGLFPGLYVVGAISSLGKTTFCLQLADQIAAAGQDVIIFSLETGTKEFIGKSISRYSLIRNLAESGSTSLAKTSRKLTKGGTWSRFSPAEKQLVENSFRDYASNAAQNVYVIEGNGDIDIEAVEARVKKHIRVTGKKPVVIIDYIQILYNKDTRLTDKQKTDRDITALRVLCRKLSLPIVGISSFNRENYTAPVNLASFKESGAIEYSCDVLLALQFAGMEYQEDEEERTRIKRVRQLFKKQEHLGKKGKAQSIQLKILKNRYGSKGESFFEFYPAFSYYKEDEKKNKASSSGEPINTDEDDTGEGWSKTRIGKGKSKEYDRDAERAKLDDAFQSIMKEKPGEEYTECYARLVDLADKMNLPQKKVREYIVEYGHYKIIGDTVYADIE